MSDSQQETVRDALCGWLQQHLPQAQNLKLSAFDKPEAGASNETLLFDAVWQQEGQQRKRALVARLAPKGPGVFPSYDLDRQYRAMLLLADSDVPVPELLGLETDRSLLGTPFYVMERIDGRVITEDPPYHMDGWFKQLPEAERHQTWVHGIQTIARINRVDWRQAGFEWLDQPQRGATGLEQQLAEYRDFLNWVERKPGARHYSALHATLAWLTNHRPRGEPTALCWGDAKVANLLVRNTEVVAALDWEMVHLGNPVDDLAWWFTLDNSLSDGIGIEKLPGLPTREQCVDIWQETSGFDAAELPYYELFGAVKFGVIMASIGLDLMNKGIFPRESEFDINNPSKLVLERLMAEFGIRG